MNLLKVIQRLTFRESREEGDFIPNSDDIVNTTDTDKALAIVLRTLNGTDLSWLTELETHIFQDVILDVVECQRCPRYVTNRARISGKHPERVPGASQLAIHSVVAIRLQVCFGGAYGTYNGMSRQMYYCG